MSGSTVGYQGGLSLGRPVRIEGVSLLTSRRIMSKHGPVQRLPPWTARPPAASSHMRQRSTCQMGRYRAPETYAWVLWKTCKKMPPHHEPFVPHEAAGKAEPLDGAVGGQGSGQHVTAALAEALRKGFRKWRCRSGARARYGEWHASAKASLWHAPCRTTAVVHAALCCTR